MNKTSYPDQQKLHEFAACIKARRTINFFKDRKVSDAFIYDAIEVARWAPNHKKTEPWAFHLLGPVTQAKVKDLIVDIKAAGQGDNVRMSIKERVDAIPGWLVISCDVSKDQITQFEDYAACACAAPFCCMAAAASGKSRGKGGRAKTDPKFFRGV